jgi:hypothetical protein
MSHLDHCRKSLDEQLQILCQHRTQAKGLNYSFVRDHALTILHLSEQMIALDHAGRDQDPGSERTETRRHG